MEKPNDTRRGRCSASGGRLLAFLLALLPGLVPAAAQALPITPTFNWRAGEPGGGPTQWIATIGSHQWTLANTSFTTPTTGMPGITRAVAFGAGDSATGIDFQSIAAGDPSNENMSFEMWFRPNTMTGGSQVLFETGGNGTGLSILLQNSTVRFRVKDGGTTRTLSYNLGINPAEFFQVAITLSLGGTASLYVDGILRTTASGVGINDWSNADDAGLGVRNGQLGGNSGNDINGYGNFLGELAILRFYRGQVLTGAQVLQNYEAVAIPEPGTVAMVALGLIGLGAAPSRLRKRL